jgi:2-oxo-hept-3-ene-1,7-dioate hydratase
MLDEKTIRSLAACIEQARQTHELIRPVTAQCPEATIEDAYAIQRAWVAIRLAEGHRVLGHKIGLTSKAMQSQSSVKEPDYGCLLDDTMFADGAEIPAGTFTAPRVEVELAFIMNKRLRGPGCTIFDVLNATDFIIPSIEILDSRLHRVDPETGKTRTIVDSIADNAGNAGLVTGGRPFKPHEADLRWVAALCLRNGQIEESGVAAAVLGHPANGIAWLANKLAAHDVALEPGQIVLSGSFIRIVEAHPGDTFHADYGPYGSVSCHFN